MLQPHRIPCICHSQAHTALVFGYEAPHLQAICSLRMWKSHVCIEDVYGEKGGVSWGFSDFFFFMRQIMPRTKWTKMKNKGQILCCFPGEQLLKISMWRFSSFTPQSSSHIYFKVYPKDFLTWQSFSVCRCGITLMSMSLIHLIANLLNWNWCRPGKGQSHSPEFAVCWHLTRNL